MFSEPDALEKLVSLNNIELKMFCTDSETGGFHTKGYIFRKEEIYRIIVGSSNMTLSAITRNYEWNTKIVSTKEGEIAQSILEEFNELWNDGHSKRYEEFCEEYKTKYRIVKEQQKIARKEQIVGFEQYLLKPNKMQVVFTGSEYRRCGGCCLGGKPVFSDLKNWLFLYTINYTKRTTDRFDKR